MRRNTILSVLICASILILFSCANSSEDTNTSDTAKQDAPHGHSTSSEYQLIGQDIAQKTQASLGQALQKAISEKGVAGAVSFCNIQALPITDSLSKALNAKIRRVSDQARNRANQAQEGELFYIDMCKKALADKKELKPFISEDEKSFMGYYPIVTNQLCSNCHGATAEMDQEVLAKINSLYPKDQAVNYKANEVRGLFVIEMEK